MLTFEDADWTRRLYSPDPRFDASIGSFTARVNRTVSDCTPADFSTQHISTSSSSEPPALGSCWHKAARARARRVLQALPMQRQVFAQGLTVPEHSTACRLPPGSTAYPHQRQREALQRSCHRFRRPAPALRAAQAEGSDQGSKGSKQTQPSRCRCAIAQKLWSDGGARLRLPCSGARIPPSCPCGGRCSLRVLMDGWQDPKLSSVHHMHCAFKIKLKENLDRRWRSELDRWRGARRSAAEQMLSKQPPQNGALPSTDATQVPIAFRQDRPQCHLRLLHSATCMELCMTTPRSCDANCLQNSRADCARQSLPACHLPSRSGFLRFHASMLQSHANSGNGSSAGGSRGLSRESKSGSGGSDGTAPSAQGQPTLQQQLQRQQAPRRGSPLVLDGTGRSQQSRCRNVAVLTFSPQHMCGASEDGIVSLSSQRRQLP